MTCEVRKPKEPVALRSALDLEIDRVWRCLVAATDPELRESYARRYASLKRERDAAKASAGA